MSDVAFKLGRDSLQSYQPSQRLTRLGRRGYQRWLLLRSQINIYYFWEKRWFFVAMLVGFIAMSLPTPEGLSQDGQIVLSMSLVATMLFITEPVPLPTVALLIVIGQVLLLKLDPTYVAQSLMTDSVLHGLADAGGGHRQAEARPAHRLADRALHRHQRLLGHLRHHFRVRHDRGLHRRAHGGGDDAAACASSR